MNEPETGCYVGSYVECGCRMAATVDSPEHAKDVRKFVSGMLRDGMRVERLATCDELRKKTLGCQNEADCKNPRQRAYNEKKARRSAKEIAS